MAEIKTKENEASVLKFIESVKDKKKKEEALVLLKLFKSIIKKEPKMWGSSIIGFDKIYYKSKSSEGEWMATGFSPRKAAHSLYIFAGVEKEKDLLKKLGKHKTGKGCLYINKLEDVDLKILKELIKKSYKYTLKNQSVC